MPAARHYWHRAGRARCSSDVSVALLLSASKSLFLLLACSAPAPARERVSAHQKKMLPPRFASRRSGVKTIALT